MPYQISIRIVRFKKPDGDYETIATSLNRFEFPSEKICELYHLRWNIENSFRELKYNIGLVNIHSKKEDNVIQEIYARLTMYNFCQRLSHMVKIEPRKDKNKYQYEINFSDATTQCIKFFRYSGNNPPDILSNIKRYISPIRPNRSDERKIKPKSVSHFIYRIA